MSSLTQLIQFSRGLIQLSDATVEAFPDGITLTFNAGNQLYIPDGAITKAKMSDTGRALIYFRYYEGVSTSTISCDTPCLLSGWTLLRVNVITQAWQGDGSNYWTVYVDTKDTTGVITPLGSISCIPSSTNPTWIDSYIGPYTATADCMISVLIDKTGTPPNFTGYIQYVIAPTDTVYRK